MADNGKTIYRGFQYELKNARNLKEGKSYSAALYLRSKNERFLAYVNETTSTHGTYTGDGSLTFWWPASVTMQMSEGNYVLEIFSMDRSHIAIGTGFTVMKSNVVADNAQEESDSGSSD